MIWIHICIHRYYICWWSYLEKKQSPKSDIIRHKDSDLWLAGLFASAAALEALGVCWDGWLQRLQWQFRELFRCVWAKKKVVGVVGKDLFWVFTDWTWLRSHRKKRVWSIFSISMVNHLFLHIGVFNHVDHVSMFTSLYGSTVPTKFSTPKLRPFRRTKSG